MVHNKVKAATAGGAIVTVVAFALGFFGIEMSAETAAGASTMLTFALGWLVKS
jgi:hypothetical protein